MLPSLRPTGAVQPLFAESVEPGALRLRPLPERDRDAFVMGDNASLTRAPSGGPVPAHEAFGGYCALLGAKLAEPTVAARREIFAYVDDHLLPALKTEEAALQLLLAPVLNQFIDRGWELGLHVERNLAGRAVAGLDGRFVVADIFSHPTGGYAVFLQPQAADSALHNLVLLPGTHPSRPTERDAFALSLGRPMGQRDDSRPAIGSMATQNLEPWFDKVVETTHAAGRKLTLAGHSLGGTVALRLFAALGDRQRRNVDVLAFVPPCFERSVAKRLEPVAEQIRIVQHRYDIVPYAGWYQAPGFVATVTDVISEGRWNVPHAKPQLALRELRGEPVAMGPYRRQPARLNYFAVVVEPVRLFFGWALWRLLKD